MKTKKKPDKTQSTFPARPPIERLKPPHLKALRTIIDVIPGFYKLAVNGATDKRIMTQWRVSAHLTGRKVAGHLVRGGKRPVVKLFPERPMELSLSGRQLTKFTREAAKIDQPKPAKEPKAPKKSVSLNVLGKLAQDEGAYGRWLGEVNAVGDLNLRPGRDDGSWRAVFEAGMSPANAVAGHQTTEGRRQESGAKKPTLLDRIKAEQSAARRVIDEVERKVKMKRLAAEISPADLKVANPAYELDRRVPPRLIPPAGDVSQPHGQIGDPITIQCMIYAVVSCHVENKTLTYALQPLLTWDGYVANRGGGVPHTWETAQRIAGNIAPEEVPLYGVAVTDPSGNLQVFGEDAERIYCRVERDQGSGVRGQQSGKSGFDLQEAT